jgi:ribosomal protein L37AE/L43A
MSDATAADGWVSVVRPDAQHACPLPDADAVRSAIAGIGSVWRCPECYGDWRMQGLSPKPNDPAGATVMWEAMDRPPYTGPRRAVRDEPQA